MRRPGRGEEATTEMRGARARMAARVVRAALVSLLGCGASEADGDDSALDAVSLAESSLAVCEGDDSSSVAAALAVAAANELGRWDALSDFQLVNGRLQL